MRKLLTSFLRKQGFETIIPTNASEASQTAGKPGLTLAIIDLEALLPAAHLAIKALRRRSSLPIVALSSEHTPLPDILSALDSGVDDMVAKPFDGLDLRRRIDISIRRDLKLRGEHANYTYCGLTIDVVDQAVRRDGRLLALSRAEYAVLAALVRAGARVVPLTDLLRVISPFSRRATERSLPGLIYRLRKKIEGGTGIPKHVLSERGIGYRLTHPSERAAGATESAWTRKRMSSQ